MQETKPINAINFADYNPRIMKEFQDGALGGSMDEFGDIGGITENMPAPGVNELTAPRLFTGHQRIRKLREKYGEAAHVYIEHKYDQPDEFGTVAVGFVGVPGTTIRWNYRAVQWPEAKEFAANIAANNVGAENDDEKLAKLDYELMQMDNGKELLAMTGQDEKQIQKLMKQIGVIDDDPPADENEDGVDKPDKLEFSMTRDQRLITERAIERIKATRELQAISSASLNGAALFVLASDWLEAHPEDEIPAGPAGELTDIPQSEVPAADPGLQPSA